MGLQKESVSTEWGGRTLTVETGTLATRANGAVTVQYGETILLVTATMAREPRPGTSRIVFAILHRDGAIGLRGKCAGFNC